MRLVYFIFGLVITFNATSPGPYEVYAQYCCGPEQQQLGQMIGLLGQISTNTEDIVINFNGTVDVELTKVNALQQTMIDSVSISGGQTGSTTLYQMSRTSNSCSGGQSSGVGYAAAWTAASLSKDVSQWQNSFGGCTTALNTAKTVGQGMYDDYNTIDPASGNKSGPISIANWQVIQSSALNATVVAINDGNSFLYSIGVYCSNIYNQVTDILAASTSSLSALTGIATALPTYFVTGSTSIVSLVNNIWGTVQAISNYQIIINGVLNSGLFR